VAKSQVERKIGRRSLIYARFCVSLAQPARGKQETSVAAKTAISRIPAMTKPSAAACQVECTRSLIHGMFSRFKEVSQRRSKQPSQNFSVAGTAAYASCYSRRAEPYLAHAKQEKKTSNKKKNAKHQPRA